METIRDSAFGKVVRFLSGYSLFLYPEEMDVSIWRKYLQPHEAYCEEVPPANGGVDFYEQYCLYTVISQASRSGRQRPSLRSVLAGPWRGVRGEFPEVISWGGTSDSEVGHHSRTLDGFFDRQRKFPADIGRILKIGASEKRF